jgi:hypothetical protein
MTTNNNKPGYGFRKRCLIRTNTDCLKKIATSRNCIDIITTVVVWVYQEKLQDAGAAAQIITPQGTLKGY